MTEKVINAGQFLQENILTLLCFDSINAPLIVSNVDIDLFESSVYREIATQAINYYRRYGQPVAEHLPDTLEKVLSKNDEKSSFYQEALNMLYEFKNQVNPEYVMENFNLFIYRQNLKLGIKEAVEAIQSGKIEDAEKALEKAKKKQLTVFDSGIRFGKDVAKSIKFLTMAENLILTGIPELDGIEACPAPKELYMFVGLSNRGKSWFMIHLAKMAMLQRKRVLYITLELSEDKVSQRMCQALFSLSKRPEEHLYKPIFDMNEQGSLSRILFKDIGKRPSFRDANIRTILKTELSKLRQPNLIIKEFPTGQLTINNLKAYLSNLENYYNFVPDMILLDYADLMYLDQERMRLDIGRTLKDLRGIAVERHLAMVSVSQTNREAMNLRWITSKNLAEDFSKLMISDNLITYNQSREEYLRGLARLYQDKSRNDIRETKILLGQNYIIGQFVMSSHRMSERDMRVIDNVIETSLEEE